MHIICLCGHVNPIHIDPVINLDLLHGRQLTTQRVCDIKCLACSRELKTTVQITIIVPNPGGTGEG